MTRDELQRLKGPQFDLVRGQLAKQRLSPNVDPRTMGWFNLEDGILYLALFREPSGPALFLDAASFQLRRHADGCDPAPARPGPLYDCFTSHIGIFFAEALGEGIFEWQRYAAGLELAALSWDRTGPERDPALSTPITLFTAALAALGQLHRHPAPARLIERSRIDPVTTHFRRLRTALVAAIDEPCRERCEDVRRAYRASVSVEDWRDAIIRGLLIQHLLPISAVASQGNILEGAINIFE